MFSVSRNLYRTGNLPPCDCRLCLYFVNNILPGVYKKVSLSSCLYLNTLTSFGGAERISSVVECLTRDRWAAGSSLIGVNLLCP